MINVFKTKDRKYIRVDCPNDVLEKFFVESDEVVQKLLTNLWDQVFLIFRVAGTNEALLLPGNGSPVYIKLSFDDLNVFSFLEIGLVANLDLSINGIPFDDLVTQARPVDATAFCMIHDVLVVASLNNRKMVSVLKKDSELVHFQFGSALIPVDFDDNPFLYILGESGGFVDYSKVLSALDDPLFEEIRQRLQIAGDGHEKLLLNDRDGNAFEAFVDVSECPEIDFSALEGAKFQYFRNFSDVDLYTYENDHVKLVATRDIKARFRLLNVTKDEWVRAPACYYLRDHPHLIKMEIEANFFDRVRARAKFKGSFEKFIQRQCMPKQLCGIIDPKSFLEVYGVSNSFGKTSRSVFDEETSVLEFCAGNEVYRLKMIQKTGKQSDEYYYDGSRDNAIPLYLSLTFELYGLGHSIRGVDSLLFKNGMDDISDILFFRAPSGDFPQVQGYCDTGLGVLCFKSPESVHLVYVSYSANKKAFWPKSSKTYNADEFCLEKHLAEFRGSCGITGDLVFQEFRPSSKYQHPYTQEARNGSRSITTYAHVGKHDHYVTLRYRDEKSFFTYFKYRFENIQIVPNRHQKAILEALAIRHFLIDKLSSCQGLYVGSQNLHLSVSSARLEKALLSNDYQDFHEAGLWHLVRYVATRCYMTPVICRNEPTEFEAQDVRCLMVPSSTDQYSEIDESIHMNGKHYFITHHAVERSQQRMVRAGSHTGWGFVVKNIIQAYSTVESSRQIREIEQNGSIVHVTPDRWRFALSFESNNLVVLKTIFHEVYKNGFEDAKKMA